MANEDMKTEEPETVDSTVKVGKAKIKPRAVMLSFNLVFLVVLVALMTIPSLILDPTHVNWSKWAASTVILVTVQVASIVIGELMGADNQMDKDNGLYQRAIRRFKEQLLAIADIEPYFSQFFRWFRKKESFSNRLDALSKAEIDEQESIWILKYLKISEVDTLMREDIFKTDCNGKKIVLLKIEKSQNPNIDQAKIIKDALSGKYDIQEDSYSYYLNYNADKGSPKSILQQGTYIENLRNSNRNRSRWTKIALFVVVSAVFSMISIDTSTSTDQTQIWINLIERLASIVGGFTSGFFTSVADIKMAATEIDFKSKVLGIYRRSYDTKAFVPKNYDEIQKEKIDEHERQAEEAKASVITPEVVKGEKEPLQITQQGGM